MTAFTRYVWTEGQSVKKKVALSNENGYVWMGSEFIPFFLHPSPQNCVQHDTSFATYNSAFPSQFCGMISYILNTPNFGSSMGAFRAALKLRPRTARVSAGSITPSSHNLNKTLCTLKTSTGGINKEKKKW